MYLEINHKKLHTRGVVLGQLIIALSVYEESTRIGVVKFNSFSAIDYGIFSLHVYHHYINYCISFLSYNSAIDRSQRVISVPKLTDSSPQQYCDSDWKVFANIRISIPHKYIYIQPK